MSRYDFKDIDIVFDINEENLGVHYVSINFRIIKFKQIIFI